MAVDADYEFFQLYGSITAVENRINTVINSVNLQYESQCGLTHRMQAIVVRTSNTDPYSTNDIGNRLDQLQAEWNGNNHPGVLRDVVHPFFGRVLCRQHDRPGICWRDLCVLMAIRCC